MSEQEKINKLNECINKASEEIESFIREESGMIKYRGISEEEEHYEIEADRAGLIRYGLEIVRSSIARGKRDEENRNEIVDVEIGQLFDPTTEVQLVRVKRVDAFSMGTLPNATPTPLKYKLIGWGAIAILISGVGFAILGFCVFLKWAI